MKRWWVTYSDTGEVLRVREGLDRFVGRPQTTVRRPKPYIANPFYCDAIDELGALARFMEAWRQTYG